MNFAAFLLAAALPIARRVFIALGLSVLTYTGLDAIINQINGYATTSMGGLSAAAVQLASLFGFQQTIAILIAAVTTKLAMAQLTVWMKS